RTLRDRGEDPEPFLLLYTMGPTRSIKHPKWDDSWPVPTVEDVDDLEELGNLRTEPPGQGVKRRFSLTVRGREQAAVLAENSPTYAGGRAPPIPEVLNWCGSLWIPRRSRGASDGCSGNASVYDREPLRVAEDDALA